MTAFLYGSLPPAARLAALAAELADVSGTLAGQVLPPTYPPPPVLPPVTPSVTRFDDCMEFVFKEEGGFANNPDDPGRATNMGITISTLTRWRTRNGDRVVVTDGDVRALTKAEARSIYNAWYWLANRCDAMPAGVDLATLDFAVTSGGAIREIQERLGVQPDGVVGPLTIAAMERFKPADLADRICDARLEYYQTLEIWSKFGAGWSARVRRIRAAAARMAAAQ